MKKSFPSRILPLLLLGISMTGAQTFPFRVLSSREGLASNRITTLYQDSQGFLWIGTAGGVSVFDGSDMISTTTRQGLPSDQVTCFFESRTSPGIVWVGTSGGGLTTVHGGDCAPAFADSFISARTVNGIVETIDSSLWFATDLGVILYREGRAIPVSAGVAGPARAIVTDRNNRIWASIGTSITVFTSDQGRVTALHPSLPGPAEIVSMSPADGDQVWAAGRDGMVYRFSSLRLTDSVRVGNVAISQIAVDGNRLAIATDNGVYFVPAGDNVISHLTPENGLPERTVTTLLVDRETNLWAGTGASGLAQLQDRSQTTFRIDPPPAPASGPAEARDLAGHLWIVGGNAVSELWIESGEWHLFDHPAEEFETAVPVSSIQIDREGNLVACFAGHLFRRYTLTARDDEPTIIESDPRRLPPAPPGALVTRLFADHRGLLWAALNGRGVAVADVKNLRAEFRIISEMPRRVSAICEDSMGSIWIGDSADGMFRFNMESPRDWEVTRISTESGLPSGEIAGITCDSSGRIWVGSRGGGLAVIEHGTSRPVPIRGLLRSESVNGIVAADSMLWLATSAGTWNVGIQDPGSGFRLNAAKGTAAFACGPLTGRLIWFRTMNGVLVFDPSARVDAPVPPVMITSIRIGGSPLAPGENNRVTSSGSNDLDVEFAAISYSGNVRPKYSYRLIGLTSQWTDPATSRHARFAALPPGEYRFEVKVVEGEDTGREATAVLGFEIVPGFLERWWRAATFGLIILAAILGTILARSKAIIRIRTEHLSLGEAEESKRKAERKRIAEELQDGPAAELLSIKKSADSALKPETDEIGRMAVLEEISKLASEAFESVDEITTSLHPVQIERQGLTRSLETVASTFAPSSKAAVRASIASIDRVFDRDSEVHIYRIVQEAFKNALVHSFGSSVDLRVERTKKHLLISLKDNGRGFDIHRANGGSGLREITERVRTLGGTLSVKSALSQGTKIRIEIPIPKRPAASH